MAKFGPYEIQTEDLDREIDRIIKSRRNPGAYLERLDKAAKKEGATNAQRRAAMRMVQKRFNSVVSAAKAGMDRAQADAAAGKQVGPDAKGQYASAEKIAGIKKSFSGAVASIMDGMMNPEPSQEGKPYGGSKELKEATRRTLRYGEAKDYKTQKKAGGGKVYAMNRRMGGPIRKPRMK